MRFALAVLMIGVVACKPPPNLATTEQQAVILLPNSFDFGSVQVGQTSGAFVDTIRPSFGENFDTVQYISGCQNFPVDAPNLPAEVYRFCDPIDPCATSSDPDACDITAFACIPSEYQEYEFATYFQPNIAGPQSCGVTIGLGDGTTHVLSLSGTGTPPPIDIDVSPGGIA
ncbi:MAG TPA: hypothetical protein VIU61_23705, partial [Kofleriaceae bacterium]